MLWLLFLHFLAPRLLNLAYEEGLSPSLVTKRLLILAYEEVLDHEVSQLAVELGDMALYEPSSSLGLRQTVLRAAGY